jgi:hypothetical protein
MRGIRALRIVLHLVVKAFQELPGLSACADAWYERDQLLDSTWGSLEVGNTPDYEEQTIVEVYWSYEVG